MAARAARWSSEHHLSYSLSPPVRGLLLLALLLHLSLLPLCHSSNSRSGPPRPSTPPPFPITASAYDTHVSLLFPLSSFSLHYHERFSLASNLLRRDAHFSSPDTSEFLDLNASHVLQLDSETGTCAAYPMSGQQTSHLYFLPSYSILGLITHLPFSSWSWAGRTSQVRNVVADHWHLSNLSTTTMDDRVLCNDEEGEYHCARAPSSVSGSYAQLIDQTTGLSSHEAFLFNFTLDYWVQAEHIAALDGSVPLRLTITGTRQRVLAMKATQHQTSQLLPIGDPLHFEHNYDWLHFTVLNKGDLELPACANQHKELYAPDVPQPLPPSSITAPTGNHRLPALSNSFSMLVDETSFVAQGKAPLMVIYSTPPVEWRRYDDWTESTEWLTTDNSTLTSHLLFYNNTDGGVVWNVTADSCSISRWSPRVNNLVNGIGRPRPLPSLFKCAQNLTSRYEYQGMEMVRGVLCYRYDASMQEVQEFGKVRDLYTFVSSVYFLPAQWQLSALPSSFLQPFRYQNDGQDLHYIDNDDEDDDHDRKGNGDDDDHKNKDGDDDDRDANRDEIRAYSAPVLRNPPVHPTHFHFADVWDLYAFAPLSSAFSFDALKARGCPLVVRPVFPPRPSAYSSTVRVSSTLTSQTYGFTEYYDAVSGWYRVDGRFHGMESIELIDTRKGTSYLYTNPLQDESAYGYASRVNYLDSAQAVAPLLRASPVQCTRTQLNSSLLSSQFIRPSYAYYLELYPHSLWVHADSDSINGFPVDQWQLIDVLNTTSGDLIFDTASFYFSQPLSMMEAQVPIRFELSRIKIYTSEDAREEQLEATVVDFVQWTPLPQQEMLRLLPAFTAPMRKHCQWEAVEQRYSTLLHALSAPASPQQFTALPAIPSSFSALIVTPLNAGSSDLTALRWYVDGVNQRQRLDYAPLSTRSPLYILPHRSTLFHYAEDWGTYDLELHGCRSVNMTTQAAINPLLTHWTGTLPSFFTGGFKEAAVYEVSTVGGVSAMCFQQIYQNVYNVYTNYSYSFARQACFALSDWEQLPAFGTQQLVSVMDSGTRRMGAGRGSGSSSEQFSIRYDVYLMDSDAPSPRLFNLTHFNCTPSGITYVPPASADEVDGGERHRTPLTIFILVCGSVLSAALMLIGVKRWCDERAAAVRRELEEEELHFASSSLQASSTDDDLFPGPGIKLSAAAAALAASLVLDSAHTAHGRGRDESETEERSSSRHHQQAVEVGSIIL